MKRDSFLYTLLHSAYLPAFLKDQHSSFQMNTWINHRKRNGSYLFLFKGKISNDVRGEHKRSNRKYSTILDCIRTWAWKNKQKIPWETGSSHATLNTGSAELPCKVKNNWPWGHKEGNSLLYLIDYPVSFILMHWKWHCYAGQVLPQNEIFQTNSVL